MVKGVIGLEPVWLSSVLVKEVPMGALGRLRDLEEKKEETFTNVSMLSGQVFVAVLPL